MKYTVKDVVCDYGVQDESGNIEHLLILNSLGNALLISKILNADDKNEKYELKIGKLATKRMREIERLNKSIEELLNALELLITEIDVVEMSEDMPISDEAYGKARRLLRNYRNK